MIIPDLSFVVKLRKNYASYDVAITSLKFETVVAIEQIPFAHIALVRSVVRLRAEMKLNKPLKGLLFKRMKGQDIQIVYYHVLH